ncbi:nucleoside-diphosphate-sugar epimerase [Bradyrhizobium sp. LM3.6]
MSTTAATAGPPRIASMPRASIGWRWSKAPTTKHYHAIAEEGVPFKAIAEVIGRRLGLPVVSKSPEEAVAHFGWFAQFVGVDVPTSSAKTRAALGWTPKEKGLIEDLDQPCYFAT